jgi:5-(carboxyamino)imidazole ribonucleotide synthase
MRNRIGIIGGGQLGRMLGMAAKQLGFHVTVVDPNPESPAGQVVDRQILGHYADETAMRQLAAEVDFLTFEIEHTNVDVLEDLAKTVSVNPSPKTLRMIQDKFAQKEFLRGVGIPVADFHAVDVRSDLAEMGSHYGYPILLKARLGAYDGRGNALIRDEAGIDSAFESLRGRPLYCERFVPFQKELAVVAARGMDGEIALYDPVETIHRNNICHEVLMPAPVDKRVSRSAHDLAEQVITHLDGAGVFAIEIFLTDRGEVVVNEIAPRVHNSGHGTIEACVTSQFEQQIRAITGLPLGKTTQIQPAAMVNLLGTRSGPVELTGLDAALAVSRVHVHVYGKAETRPERKMGHVTATADTLELALMRARDAAERIAF